MRQKANIVVDSDAPPAVALAQNPLSPAPQDILRAMRMADVAYRGFDEFLHKGQIVMHADVVEEVRTFFVLALTLGFPIHSVIPISDSRFAWDDEVSCDANNSSGFNYRRIAGTNKLSRHAYGAAFDINPVQNIYVRYDDRLQVVFMSPAHGIYNERAVGTLTGEHPLVLHMKKLGWEWGGDWTPESGRTDYQHFEKDIPH